MLDANQSASRHELRASGSKQAVQAAGAAVPWQSTHDVSHMYPYTFSICNLSFMSRIAWFSVIAFQPLSGKSRSRSPDCSDFTNGHYVQSYIQ